MFSPAYYEAIGMGDIHEKVVSRQRLTPADGLKLFTNPFHNAVGALASHVRFRKFGANTSYVVNRQVNYTNVCVNGCLFCAFRRDDLSQPGAFVLEKEEIMKLVDDSCRKGADAIDELHMVGGCHPNLPLAWFEDLIATIRERHPGLPVKAFTPVEIAHFAKLDGICTREVLIRLKRAGLSMMPGGGAEIFDAELRAKLCPHKADAEKWLEISGEAHRLGIATNCTMLFGHIENYDQRIDHLVRLREQQDASGGFTCFIPLPFLKKNSRLRLPPEKMGPVDGLDYLRTIAVSRLMLDNIPHIKAYWVMLGPKLAQTALWYGADDLDGTIEQERIGHMAGAASARGITIRELEHMIRKSGFIPVRRNATFRETCVGEVA